MTRIAVMADIHGNLPALEAVVEDMRRVAPDQVIVAGDVINRGPQSKACLDLVREAGWPVLYGNHEDYVLKFEGDNVPEAWLGDWWLPTRSVAQVELTADDLAYLKALPLYLVVDVLGLPAIRVVHGSPRAINEGLGFWMSDDDLIAAVEMSPEPVVIGAHTHRPFDRRAGRWWALNTGAVGTPFNGNPAAQYLVLTARDGDWQVDFRAVPYDRAPVYAAWEQTGHLERSTAAQVFKFEVETATFHLMAYMEFCETRDLPLNAQASFARYREAAAGTPPGRSHHLAAS